MRGQPTALGRASVIHAWIVVINVQCAEHKAFMVVAAPGFDLLQLIGPIQMLIRLSLGARLEPLQEVFHHFFVPGVTVDPGSGVFPGGDNLSAKDIPDLDLFGVDNISSTR